MKINLYDRLAPLATPRVVVGLILLFLVLSLAVFMPVGARLNALTQGEVGLMDGHFSYSPYQAFKWVDAYGPEGRQLHGLTTLTADTLYPPDYALLLALVILLTYRAAFPAFSRVRLLVWLPFIAAAWDLAENAGFVILLATHPQWHILVGDVTSLSSSLKWIFFVLSVLLALIGLAGWGVARLHPK